MTKVLVTGGRTYDDRGHVYMVLDGLLRRYPALCVVQGGAKGADRLASLWAAARGKPCITMAAAWDALGPAAGSTRNQWMLDYNPDIAFCVAFPGGPGTADMKRRCAGKGIKVYEA